jgi:hypothetical protein
MKHILSTCIIIFLLTGTTFGQKISETNFSLGINKTSSPDQQMYWNENPPPIYIILNASKLWYRDNHRISFGKELGFNLQYSDIDLDSGGNGAHSWRSGNIISLFADAALLVRFRINKTLAFGIGPEAEILMIGKNNINSSYYISYTNPPVSGEKYETGLNRDYFNQPSYGIKLCLFESGLTKKTTIGLNFSYLWTKSESSNFYAANFARISFLVGFKQKETK